jgi:hypothetical protein
MAESAVRYEGSVWYVQLQLLLWKNWLLKKRAWLNTIIEILAPVVAVRRFCPF